VERSQVDCLGQVQSTCDDWLVGCIARRMADPFLRIKQHSNIFDHHGSRLFRAFCSRRHVVTTVFAKAEGSPKGIFQYCFLGNFRPDRLKCRVRAHVGAKPIKNYEGSCECIERVFQKAELRVGCAGVGGFGADVFKQKSDGPVRMGFSRNAIGDPVSWFPDVTIAAFFCGGYESGKSVAPIAVILGFGKNPLVWSV